MKKRMLVAGGSGLIGTALKALAESMGWEVLVLSRSRRPGYITWHPADGTLDHTGVLEVDAIINLAGENIAGRRWTPRQKRRILQSRLDAAGALHEWVREERIKTKVYIGSSGVGYYGEQGDREVTETSPPGPSEAFMTQTVVQWEAAHHKMETLGVRTVILRTGIVLSPKGGALREILRTAPFGVLATFGSGKAFMPWIHIRDMARVIMWAATAREARGVFLACAPKSVRNRELVRACARALGGWKWIVPVPRVALAVVLGEMHEALFQSCRAKPDRLEEAEFQFDYPDIDSALLDLLKRR